VPPAWLPAVSLVERISATWDTVGYGEVEGESIGKNYSVNTHCEDSMHEGKLVSY